MDSRTDHTSSTHVGRIGALAVALGIGAAMTSGAGVAWAEDAGNGSPDRSSGQSASADSSSASAGPTRRSSSRAALRGARGVAVEAPAKDAAPELPARAGDVTEPPLRAVTEIPERDDSPAAVLERDDPAPLAVTPSPRISAPAPAPASVTVVEADVPQAAPTPAAAVAPAPRAALPRAVSLDAVAPQIVPTAVESPAVVSPLPAKATTVTSPRIGSRLLSALGLAPSAAGTGPGAPAGSPALWALLGWVRRDMGRTGVRTAAAQSALPSAAVSTAMVTTPRNLPTAQRGWVTGQRNALFPGATWTQTNNTRWANVYGTDLGIMWFNGVNGKVQVAFGDTFSGPNMTGDWRNNILLLSDDTNLTDGMSLINTGPAFQFIPAARDQVFFIGSEVTNIPTAALYANDNNYVNYMSVKSWDTPGRWTTNYSGISQYNPDTDRWVLQKQTVRSAGWFRSSTRFKAGDQNFQQMAYVLEPESKVADGEPRYVYAFGTPSGRAGSAYLSRVPENAVTDLEQYRYWDGDSWVTNQAFAAPVLGESTRSGGLFGWARDIANNPRFFGGWFAGFTGAKTGGYVSEMSVQYNEYLDKYVVLYGNRSNNIVMRTADTPEGPWSEPITLVTSLEYPGLYAPFVHPLSGTGQLTDSSGNPDISNLYWTMSLWGNYNVVLMQTDLAPMVVTAV